ncbi:hypothetical protein BH09ACT11_BH09ACT11_05320 [soil metagenome]
MAFVDLLREADAEFEDAAFEPALADAVSSHPELTLKWNLER